MHMQPEAGVVWAAHQVGVVAGAAWVVPLVVLDEEVWVGAWVVLVGEGMALVLLVGVEVWVLLVGTWEDGVVLLPVVGDQHRRLHHLYLMRTTTLRR